jgi:molybdenum cofactor biosynthesis enzyme
MVKGIDKHVQIESVRRVAKDGDKSGPWRRDE